MYAKHLQLFKRNCRQNMFFYCQKHRFKIYRNFQKLTNLDIFAQTIL